jgi:WD40 repeat protein
MDASGSPIRLKVVKRGNLPTPLVRSVRVDVQNVKAVATSVDGSVFLGSSDLVFDKVYQHIGSVVASCFIPENKWLVTAGGEGKVVIYDWSAKKNVRVFQLASVSKEIRYAGSYLYIIDVDGRLWRLDYRSDGATAEEIGSKGLRYQSLAVASKHEWLLVGTNNGKVLVFNTNDVKAKAAELTRKHTGVVSSVAVSWDENFLTTASLDGTVFFWDLRQNAKLTGLAPVNMQYPDNMPNRKVFNVEFLGSDYILMGDNAHLRLGIINIQKAYDRLNSLLKQQRLPDELWKYYIKGNLTRP